MLEKIEIKSFKDGSSNFFVNMKHYHLNKNNEIEFCAGGEPTEEEFEAIKQFIKRNKKVYTPRSKNIFENE